MSQRKEKYMRRALEQYDGVALDVDDLKRRVGVIEVMHKGEASRAAAARAEQTAKEAQERIRRRHEDHKNQRRLECYLCIALSVGIATIVAIVYILASVVDRTPAAASAVPTRVATEQVAAPLVADWAIEAQEAGDENERIEAALLAQGYLRDDVPLTYAEQDFLQTACEEFSVPYALALAVIEQESEFRNIPNPDGTCLGYMQIMPRWHSGRAEALGVENLMEPYGNFRVGCSYLGELLAKYDTGDALCVYKSGSPGESSYSREVLTLYEKWEGVLRG